jgi:hypothetical protein
LCHDRITNDPSTTHFQNNREIQGKLSEGEIVKRKFITNADNECDTSRQYDAPTKLKNSVALLFGIHPSSN